MNNNVIIDVGLVDKSILKYLILHTGGSPLNVRYELRFGETHYKAVSDAEEVCKDNGDLHKLKNIGLKLYHEFLPKEIRSILYDHKIGDRLLFRCEQNCCFIPWEIFYDNHEFFGKKYVLGRIVTSDSKHVSKTVSSNREMALIVGNVDRIEQVQNEVAAIKKLLAGSSATSINLKYFETLSQKRYQEELFESEIIHFSGHSRWDGTDSGSGLLLKDSLLSLSEIRNLSGTHNMPNLIFLNSCFSCASDENDWVSGFASAFLSAGTQNFLGCTHPVDDSYAAEMSREFYSSFKNGISPAEALTTARKKMPGTMWGLYRLYGDPCFYPAEKQSEYDNEVILSRKRNSVGKKAIIMVIIIAAVLLIISLFIPFGKENILYLPPKF